MQSNFFNYRIIVTVDKQTGTGKAGYTAFCPTLGIADDGDTVEEALENLKKAIEIYVASLAEDGEEIPMDFPEKDVVTTMKISTPRQFRFKNAEVA